MIRRIPVGKEKRLPDLINAAPKANFTMVPNAILRNPEISAVAKSILMLTLSNKEGWASYSTAIGTMMKEGRHARENGIRELEDLGFLRRIYYCDPKTKLLTGSFWCVSSQAGQFDEEAIEERLEKQHVLQCGKPGPNKENGGVRELGYSSPGDSTIADGHQIRPSLIRPKEDKKGIFDTIADFLFFFPLAWQKNPEFCEAAAEYFHHRELQPKGFTEQAAKQAANKLKKVSMENATAALLKAVEKKWTGVFPEEETKPAATSTAPMRKLNHRQPSDIIADAFPNELTQATFTKTIFRPAMKTLDSKDTVQAIQLAKNLVALFLSIQEKQKQIPRNDHRWGPMKIIQYYVDWLDEQDWITSKGAYLYAPGATVFERQFITAMIDLHMPDYRNPITGLTT